MTIFHKSSILSINLFTATFFLRRQDILSPEHSKILLSIIVRTLRAYNYLPSMKGLAIIVNSALTHSAAVDGKW
jgi:hypothetical protein